MYNYAVPKTWSKIAINCLTSSTDLWLAIWKLNHLFRGHTCVVMYEANSCDTSFVEPKNLLDQSDTIEATPTNSHLSFRYLIHLLN